MKRIRPGYLHSERSVYLLSADVQVRQAPDEEDDDEDERDEDHDAEEEDDEDGYSE